MFGDFRASRCLTGVSGNAIKSAQHSASPSLIIEALLCRRDGVCDLLFTIRRGETLGT